MIDYETFCKIRDYHDKQGLKVGQIDRALVRPIPKIYVSAISTLFAVGILTPAIRAKAESPNL